jgi:outer membrane lipoprotein-sorting protein
MAAAAAWSRGVRRAAVPTAVVAGIAVAGAGIWPAIASDGSPDLPTVTAEELLTQVAASDTEQLSGTVRVDANLGNFGIPEQLDLGSVVSSVLGEDAGPAGALANVASGDSTLRVAMDGPERQRLAVADGSEEFAVIHNGDELWAYDSGSNTVYEATVPEGDGDGKEDLLGSLTPQQAAERFLDAAGEHADISVDGTSRVAGRDAYQLLVEPTGEAADELGGEVTEIRVAVDAETGVPLAVTTQGEDGQLLDVSFSQITYEQPAGGTFDFTPPEDAEVHELDPGASLIPGLLN